jgi:hypothetical protein
VLRVKAIFICEDLCETIVQQKLVYAKVHSVFKNALNLIISDRIITILKYDKYLSPMSLILDTDEHFDFLSLKLKPYHIFQLTEEYILCEDNKLYIDLINAKSRKLQLIATNKILDWTRIKANIASIENCLMEIGQLSGCGGIISMLGRRLPELELGCFTYEIGSYEIFIIDRLVRFIEAMITGSAEEICKASLGIIGYGKGLTPSMDDFLCGVLLVNYLIYINRELGSKVNWNISESIVLESKDRTTRISWEMLRHALYGRTNEAVHQLLRIIAYGEETTITQALARVVKIGGTSGTDLSLGIYTGFKLLINCQKDLMERI